MLSLTRLSHCVLAFCCSMTMLLAEEAASPQIVSIQTWPEKLVLHDVRDARGLLVIGRDAAGKTYDLTADAVVSATTPHIEIDAERFVNPREVGSSEVIVTAKGHEQRVPVVVENVEPRSIDYVRDFLPHLSKHGCNQGTCHGAQQGRKGFKLSLRGYDPLYDYRALVDDVSGRRFNRTEPAQSLMLLKPTQGVPHEGGFLFDEQSRAYRDIAQWIAEGCQFSETTRPVRLELFPSAPTLDRRGERQQVQVIAHYDDGQSRDVTRDAMFEASNFEVATVTKGGQIQAVRRGETAVLVRYEGVYGNLNVTVLGNREGFVWQPAPEFNFIDQKVNQKLERLKALPSAVCTDAEFLRRVTLDLTGLPASADQTRAFLDDSRDSRSKREALIDDLLNSPEYVDHWTLKWSDLLLSNRKFIKEQGVWGFRNWIRQSLAENKPYDQFAFELMTASGNSLENPAANYYRIAREPREVMENMTQVFLGTRFVCAQCHDHPFEKWTQTQYFELSAYFGGVGRKAQGTEAEVIYDLRNPQTVMHGGTGQPAPPKFPFTVTGYEASGSDVPRLQLAKWLVSAENPYFAKSLVNRYWSYLLGRGIIDPVDDIRLSNPASNPELLDALTADFIAHDFDLKHLLRTIAASQTYQRSFITNEWNKDDDVNYSHASPRRLQAEQLYDAIMVATGAPMGVPGAPTGFRASQLPDAAVNVPFLDMFGRAPRESPCECERSSEVSLAQTLTLINGPTISDAIAHPQGLVQKLVTQNVTPKEAVAEIYLSVLNGLPDDTESNQGTAYVTEHGLLVGGQDLMWALINSPAFLFNR
ncbi:DUF1553 domain-containing protein [bacterium]|nr:DUF1553 domain-containing protein [bacterium]